jgi:CheY-like chemotaxis protein
VTARSEGVGRGATFTVRLPIAILFAESARPVADFLPADVPRAASLDGVSVLLVDDDMESREVLAAHLQEAHAEVVTAASAAEAFELLQRRHVDVLLADIAMPDEDGYSLIRRIRAGRPEMASIPAAAVTAFAAEDDRQRALRAGFQLHLSKPIDAHTLVSAVAELGRSGSRMPV